MVIVVDVPVRSGRVTELSRQDDASTGGAAGAGAVSTIESHTLGSQLIHVRRLDALVDEALLTWQFCVGAIARIMLSLYNSLIRATETSHRRI